MNKPTYIQVLSIASMAMIVGTFVTVTFFVSHITELDKQIDTLNKEVLTLKAEIVDLKEQLVKSKIIIEEQRENITATK